MESGAFQLHFFHSPFYTHDNNKTINWGKNIGFFSNKTQNRTSVGSLNLDTYDYSWMLASLLGLDGGTCVDFQMIEAFIAKYIDPDATIEHQALNGDHVAIKASTNSGNVIVDLSGTKYHGGNAQYDQAGRNADGLFNDTNWRNYVSGVLGSDLASEYFGF